MILEKTFRNNSIQTVSQLSLTIYSQIHGENLEENREPKKHENR